MRQSTEGDKGAVDTSGYQQIKIERHNEGHGTTTSPEDVQMQPVTVSISRSRALLIPKGTGQLNAAPIPEHELKDFETYNWSGN